MSIARAGVWGVFAVACCLAIVAAALAQETDPEVLARGERVYLEQRCGFCHSLSRVGAAGAFGPSHDAMAVIAQARVQDPAYSGDAVDAAGYLRESILEPAAYMVPGYAGTYHRMPAYTFLSEGDLDALIAFLMSIQAGDEGGRDM